MLTFTTLASGSGGNAALVSCGDTHLLLDAGISAKQITAGLAALGVAPRDLTAILITHEHSDHVSGLRVLSKRAAAPIYATGPTCRCLYDRNTGSEAADLRRVMEAGTGVQLGGLWVQSFPTPHDAAGSVGYILSGEGGRIVLATDLGYITPAVKTAVQDCGLLICEANHDEDWVRSGPYPYYLKQRILGDRGHLSNEAGAELAALAAESGTRAVVLAHLSRENNTPARAWETAARRLRSMGCEPNLDLSLTVAPRSGLGPTYQLESGRVLQASPSGEEAALC